MDSVVICMMEDGRAKGTHENGRNMTSGSTAQRLTSIDGLPRIGQGSLTEQTTQALLQAVLDRRFPTDRLPTEPELARQMGVSRTTIRAALHTLDRHGVISRTPGRGTLLRPHISRDCMLLHRLIGFRGMLEANFGEVRTEQTFTVRKHGSQIAMETLGIDAQTRMLVNDKTYIADGHPVVHLHQEVPVSYVADGLAERLAEGLEEFPSTIFEFSRSWPGREIDHSVVEFVPQVLPKRRPATFPLPLRPGKPYLEMRETHYSETNEPVCYSGQIVDDEFVRLKVVRPH